MKSPEKILLIAVPGIGDALLATPLIRSLRRAYPQATIDVLVRTGRANILRSNPDVSQVLEQERRPSLVRSLAFLVKQFRSYDLAVSTSASDRSFAISFFCARRRVSVVPPLRLNDWWKSLGTTKRVVQEESQHFVVQNLRLADALGIQRCYEVVAPEVPETAAPLSKFLSFVPQCEPYAVFHMLPGPVYKRWPTEHWHVVIQHLVDRGLRVVLTSGPVKEDIAYVRDVASAFSSGVVEVAGKLEFYHVAELIGGADVFLGPDTSTTHLAAATGTPTVGLYGPTNVLKWAPWPKGYAEDRPPFAKGESVQKNGNVMVLQAKCECIPYPRACVRLGIEASECLPRLSPKLVCEQLDDLLPLSKTAVNH